MNNDQEWRHHLFEEIKEIRKDLAVVKSEMISLKVKVATFSAIIGSIASYLANKILG